MRASVLTAVSILIFPALTISAFAETKSKIAPRSDAMAYLCKFTSADRGMPNGLGFLYTPGRGGALVFDGYIKGKYGKPIPAGVRDTADTLRFGWVVADVPDRLGNAASLKFNVIYVKATRKIIETLQVLSYDNGIMQAKGSCELEHSQ